MRLIYSYEIIKDVESQEKEKERERIEDREKYGVT